MFLRYMGESVWFFFWLFANLAHSVSFLAGYWWKIIFLDFFFSDRLLCIKTHRIRYGRAKSKKKSCVLHTSIVRAKVVNNRMNCSLCPKSTKITGDMYFYVFFHIRIGATLGNYSDPPFWGVKAPLFWVLFNY